jgi:mercuric ion transport protein
MLTARRRAAPASGALAASSCCVLPLALAGLGAGSAVFGGLEVLANWRPLLLGGAVVVVLVGWTLFFWRRSAASCVDGSCAVYTPAKSAGVYLSVATAFIAVSIIWDPYIEPVLLKLVR